MKCNKRNTKGVAENKQRLLYFPCGISAESKENAGN